MIANHPSRRLGISLSAAAILVLGACGGGEKSEKSEAAEEKAEAAPGRVIVVNATTDEKGSYFSPADIEARPGDVLRFTLVVGVHNVNFLPDSNAGKSGLPAPTEMLQLPGQTIDVPLTFGEGRFYFQCDPHAALGMHGHVTVKD
ncbi:MAG TPA: plastocyanin/azurin family copper-binding protein [Gemmatimonadales bacterium]|nr:plastocyanin/azurin family copper-binding protein [Gemmatimonadales bacterium]